MLLLSHPTSRLISFLILSLSPAAPPLPPPLPCTSSFCCTSLFVPRAFIPLICFVLDCVASVPYRVAFFALFCSCGCSWIVLEIDYIHFQMRTHLDGTLNCGFALFLCMPHDSRRFFSSLSCCSILPLSIPCFLRVFFFLDDACCLCRVAIQWFGAGFFWGSCRLVPFPSVILPALGRGLRHFGVLPCPLPPPDPLAISSGTSGIFFVIGCGKCFLRK